MKFIKHVGARTTAGGTKKMWAEFLCPFCESSVEREAGAGNRQHSCGCVEGELKRIAKTKHGLRYEKIYAVWNNMIRRCSWPGSTRYSRYGGRGISVCDEWGDIKVFKAWAVSNGYKDGLQIDRIDNDGNYSPENCRFVTCAKNVRNSTSAKLSKEDVLRVRELLCQGATQAQAADAFGVSKCTVSDISRGKTWV